MADVFTLQFSVFSFAKIAVLFALSIYIVFAIVIVRQVNIMTKTLEVGFEFALKVIAVMHFLFSIGTFALALLIL